MDVTVAARSGWNINANIQVEASQVIVSGPDAIEENASLYLYPVNDNEFCIHLYYITYAEGREDGWMNVHKVVFLPQFFQQFPADMLMSNQPFRFDQTTEQPFTLCGQTRQLLTHLKQREEEMNAFVAALQDSETCTQLLRRALQCITVPFTTCQVPACRFLTNESEREKVFHAKALIEQNPGYLFTIKELSRKVAMNECYLKKGFKALLGKPVHEFQHELRIANAKKLLQAEGKSVSEVADALGFSSISHFSTAFKKATGIKPCELLS